MYEVQCCHVRSKLFSMYAAAISTHHVLYSTRQCRNRTIVWVESHVMLGACELYTSLYRS